MLQMIPLASKDKAQAFVSFNDGIYSCPSKLYHTIYDTSTSASSSSSSSSSSSRGLNEGSSSSSSSSSSSRGLNEASSSNSSSSSGVGGIGVGRQIRNNSKRSRKPNSYTNNNNQGLVSFNHGTSVVSTSTATTTMMTMISNSTASTQARAAVAVSQGTARPLQSRHEDKNAFQNCFGSNKQGVVKNQSKLSRHVFNLMTATDPNALINNI